MGRFLWFYCLLFVPSIHSIVTADESRKLRHGRSQLNFFDLRGSQTLTYRFLDALAKVPYGHTRQYRRIPRTVWKRTYDCLREESVASLDLVEVSDAAYRGFVNLAVTNDTGWGMLQDIWLENDPTPLTTNNDSIPGGTAVIINEPCNSISNIATYRSLYSLCARSNIGPAWNVGADVIRALVQSFNFFSFSSIFLHASLLTNLRETYNRTRDILAFVAWQALAKALDDPFLFNLSNTTRALTSIQVAEAFSQVFLLTEDPNDWLAFAQSLDIPLFSISFSSIAIAISYLAIKSDWVESIIDAIIDILVTEEEGRNFVLEEVKPAIRDAIRNRDKIPFLKRTKLAFGLFGVVIKTIYGFTWQEEIAFFDDKLDYSSSALNTVGSLLIPTVNLLSNTLQGNDRWSDPSFQYSLNVYPGGRKCNFRNAHSKFHEISSNFYIDYMFLVDDSFRLLTGKNNIFKGDDATSFADKQAGAVQCFVENDCFRKFEFSGVENALADPFLVSFGDCFKATFAGDQWEGSELTIFEDCFMTSLVTSSRQSDVKEDRSTTEPDTLDACLVEKDCFVFQGGSIDVDVLQSCIAQEDNTSPCGSYLTQNQAEQLETCLTDCENGILCTTGCFHKAGIEISETFSVASTCLNALFLDGETDPEQAQFFQAACEMWADQFATFQEDNALSPATTIAQVLTRGLPTLATCATTTQQCQTSYAATPIRGVFSCARTCSTLQCLFSCFNSNM